MPLGVRTRATKTLTLDSFVQHSTSTAELFSHRCPSSGSHAGAFGTSVLQSIVVSFAEGSARIPPENPMEAWSTAFVVQAARVG